MESQDSQHRSIALDGAPNPLATASSKPSVFLKEMEDGSVSYDAASKSKGSVQVAKMVITSSYYYNIIFRILSNIS